MSEEKSEKSTNYEFPLNQRLLEESLKLKEEGRILKERLKKIETSRSDVSDKVYERVHTDYTNRLQKVNDQLLEKKQDIDRELATLYETRDKIQGNLQSHKHALEEIQFRHQLGEFNKEEYQRQAKKEEDKVNRFEQVLAGVHTNIKRYEGLFEGAEDLFGTEPASKETPHRAAPEEVDEWEEEAKAAQGENGGPLEMAKEEWLEDTRPSLEISPKITVIAGKDYVGKSFPIENSFTIGRSHTNQLMLKDAKVSRQHAEIKLQGGECLLIDLNSSNGTSVNGQKIHEQILSPNDEIQIGDFVLQYQQ